MLPRRTPSTRRGVTAVANPACTTFTRPEGAVATRIASAPSAASTHTTTGTAANPNKPVVAPVRSPIPVNITTSTGPPHQGRPPSRMRRSALFLRVSATTTVPPERAVLIPAANRHRVRMLGVSTREPVHRSRRHSLVTRGTVPGIPGRTGCRHHQHRPGRPHSTQRTGLHPALPHGDRRQLSRLTAGTPRRSGETPAHAASARATATAGRGATGIRTGTTGERAGHTRYVVLAGSTRGSPRVVRPPEYSLSHSVVGRAT